MLVTTLVEAHFAVMEYFSPPCVLVLARILNDGSLQRFDNLLREVLVVGSVLVEQIYFCVLFVRLRRWEGWTHGFVAVGFTGGVTGLGAHCNVLSFSWVRSPPHLDLSLPISDSYAFWSSEI